MQISKRISGALLLAASFAAGAASTDPSCVVESWSDASAFPKIIDINFTDSRWPASWQGNSGVDCPSYSDGGYVNAILDVQANPAADVDYPVLFHNCTFANKGCKNKMVYATAAFSRIYHLMDKATGNSTTTMNNWTVPGHTVYLEDNIATGSDGKPLAGPDAYGEAGFVQMCRDAATTVGGRQTSMHGWMEIDHVPYIERVQWSWSSTSWGRGIKCDIKIGDGDWKPLVWMGSERQKQGCTVFSDQGYFMENVIDAHDVSLRWRVWDGEDLDNPVQGDCNGGTVFTQAIDPMAQRQAPRVHKVRIYGNPVTAADAAFARANPVGDVGELSDLSEFGGGSTVAAPDAEAPVVVYTVAKDGSADYTSIQSAIDAVEAGYRGIIHIAPGIYEENVYAGRKGEPQKFISLIGEDPATTILTSAVNRGGNSANTYLDCAALNVFCPRFYAEGLTIRNTSGNVGQAEALYTAGDAHIFRNCVIEGYQDTFKANVGARGYFTGCTVAGATDFIYDGGLEWFDNCEIRSVAGGYITAPAESGMPMVKGLYPALSADVFYAGLFFDKCRITADDGVAASSVSLGRPWKETCGAMFMNSVLGNHISPAGWTAWGGSENKASLYEYRNTGTDGQAVDTSRRASFSRQASDEEVEEYFSAPTLFGLFSKVPFDINAILGSAAAPSGISVSADLVSWDADDNAAAYILYKNGAFEAILTAPSFIPEEGATYTIRTVSRFGVTSGAVEARESSRLLAFPTAEGFGKYTTGGRGGKVVTVTSLADDGSEGTLRWAFEQHKGSPITIVFAVTGDITLTRELRVNRSDWTLAGQSAPGEGIVITHNKVNFGGSQNFIVRNVRFRIGQKSVSGDVLMDNACGSENCANYIFDHCSFGWSVEENMNTADSHFLTVQYSIVHEGLYNGGHSKGARGYGSQWGGSPATYHHNLLAHNQSRSPRFNGARGEDYVVFIEYANNVNYNYGSAGACYGGENTAAISTYNGLNSAHECNFMNNYYRPGTHSDRNKVVFVNASYARDGATSWAPAKWYVNGNHAAGFANITADNWLGMTAETYSLADIRADERIVPATPYYRLGAPAYRPELYMLRDIEDAATAFNTVLDKAGTVNRDKVEQRVINDARTGTSTYGGMLGSRSGIIDKETDAEGFFSYINVKGATDTDGDGMPDSWERSVGLNPSAADNNIVNTEGYTALEVYLASLMGETLSTDFTGGVEAVEAASASMSYDRATRTLTVSDDAIGATVSVYSTAGTLLMSRTLTSASVSLGGITPQVVLIDLRGKAVAPRLLKTAL